MIAPEFVCPRCGTTARGERFCGSCGLELAVQYELPTRQAWERGQRSGTGLASAASQSDGANYSDHGKPADAGRPGGSPLRDRPQPRLGGPASGLTIGLSILLAASVLAICASFLPAVSTSDFDSVSYTTWEVNTVSDVFALLVSLAVAAAATLQLTNRRSQGSAFVLLLLGITLSVAVVEGLEFSSAASRSDGALGGGTILGMMCGVASIIGVSMFILNGGTPVSPTAQLRQRSRRGFLLLAPAGFLFPIVYLLPFANDFSAWQSSSASDVAYSVVAAVLSGLCLVRLQSRELPFHTEMVLALGSLLAYVAINTAIETLAAGATQIGVYAMLLVVAPTLTTGVAFLTLDHAQDTGTEPRSVVHQA